MMENFIPVEIVLSNGLYVIGVKNLWNGQIYRLVPLEDSYTEEEKERYDSLLKRLKND